MHGHRTEVTVGMACRSWVICALQSDIGCETLDHEADSEIIDQLLVEASNDFRLHVMEGCETEVAAAKGFHHLHPSRIDMRTSGTGYRRISTGPLEQDGLHLFAEVGRGKAFRILHEFPHRSPQAWILCHAEGQGRCSATATEIRKLGCFRMRHEPRWRREDCDVARRPEEYRLGGLLLTVDDSCCLGMNVIAILGPVDSVVR